MKGGERYQQEDDKGGILWWLLLKDGWQTLHLTAFHMHFCLAKISFINLRRYLNFFCATPGWSSSCVGFCVYFLKGEKKLQTLQIFQEEKPALYLSWLSICRKLPPKENANVWLWAFLGTQINSCLFFIFGDFVGVFISSLFFEAFFATYLASHITLIFIFAIE